MSSWQLIPCVIIDTWITKSIRQRDAIAELHALGDHFQIGYGNQEDESIWYMDHKPPSPGLIERLLGIDFVEPATRVSVFPSNHNSDLSKAATVLAKLPSLEKLCFDGCDEDLTDESLPALVRIKRLRILDIRFHGSHSLTGVGFKSLAALPDLHELSLIRADNLSSDGSHRDLRNSSSSQILGCLVRNKVDEFWASPVETTAQLEFAEHGTERGDDRCGAG